MDAFKHGFHVSNILNTNEWLSNYININAIFKYKYCTFVVVMLSSISCTHCGLVAYSTELEGKNTFKYTYSLDSFREIWMYMFLCAISSIFLVHILASVIALATLRKHKYGRYVSILILLYGTASAFFVTCFTSAVVAFVLYQAKIEVLLIHAMLCGFSQLGTYLFLTFFTLKPTL